MTATTGAGTLLRLAMRRDRILLPAWLSVLVLSAWSSAAATVELYPDVQSRVTAAEALNASSALVALYGRIYDVSSLGAIALLKMNGMGSAMVAVLAIIVTIRHTRADEEAGRHELVGAAVVGRQAALAAAMSLAVISNVALGIVTAASLVAAGLPVGGSVAFGLAWTGVGIGFAGVAAVVAQLVMTARSATGVSLSILGVAYVLRAVGDTVGPSWLSWFSPFGWQQQVRPYAGERWWVLGLLAAFAALCVVAAFVLAERRDLGAGLFADRAGPSRAPSTLRHPLGLAWRLQRGVLLWWGVVFVGLGILLGAIVTSVGGMLDSEQARQLIEQLGGEKALNDAFLAAEFGFVGVIASAYGIQAAARLHAEEAAGRAEPILAGAVGRIHWTMSHVVIALLGSAALLAATGLSTGVTYALAVDDPNQIGRTLVAALVQLPAVWLLVGLVVAFFGFFPRGVVLGWVALVGFMLIGEVGPLLKVDQWVLDLSPYAHVPQLPGGEITVAPLVGLLGVAALLLALGLVGIRRRDVG